jgi:patatin-like phospholipase/acyl hydrolase
MMKYLSAALAAAIIAGTSAAPALAAPRTHNAVTQPHRLYMFAPGGLPASGGPDLAREQAMHDCNMQASKWSFSSWETTQLATYGTCMTQHGQTP